MTDTELMTCPFCGMKPKLYCFRVDISEPKRFGSFVTCQNDMCPKPKTAEYVTTAEAVAAWNTRAGDWSPDPPDLRGTKS